MPRPLTEQEAVALIEGGASTSRYLTEEEALALVEPETTFGGVARAGALGAARGAFALPEVAGAVMEHAPMLAGPLGPVVGPVIKKGAQLATRGAERLLGGPTVGDTGFERLAGVGGEVLGAVGTGGVALAPVRGAGMAMAARGVRAIPSMTGATGGIHVAREAELGPVGQVAGALIGAGGAAAAAKTAGLVGRGVKQVAKKALIREGEQPLGPTTRLFIQRTDEIAEESLRLGNQYRVLEEAADTAGGTVSTASVKQGVKELRAKLVPADFRTAAGKIIKDIDDLPERVSLRELRGFQRAVNERLTRAKGKRGGAYYPLRKLNKIMAQAMEEAADDPTLGHIAEGLRMTNAAWARNQRSEAMLNFWKKGADTILKPSGRINPGAFVKWLRDNPSRVREFYGNEHYQNLLRLGKNIRKIPDDVAATIAGPLDAERAATLEALKTGIRIATVQIGGYFFRGRRYSEMFSRVFRGLMDERRGVAVVKAMDDPALARELVRTIPGRTSLDPLPLTYPARLALPGVAGER